MVSKWEQIERSHDKPMSEILISLYEQYGHEPNAQDVIASRLGISQPTLSIWLKLLGLKRKVTLLKPQPCEGGDQPVDGIA